MASYQITAPDGNTYKIDGPEGASESQVVSALLAQYPEAGRPAPKGESGFIPAAKAGWENLKGDIGLVAGKAGLMSLKEAEAYKQEREAAAKKIFKPTEEGWTESPWTKLKELAGGSAPYMLAPLAVGTAATVAGAPGLAAAGLGGLASAAQFTGSNLSRQMDTGKSLEQADLGKAALAAIPQAALDTVSMRMIPGLGKLMGAAGMQVTAETAEALAKQSLAKVAGDYALATGKTMTVEGLTEAAQQVFERMQAGLQLTDPEARKEYFDNFLGGAILGGAIAPAGRYMERQDIKAKAVPSTQPAPPSSPAAPSVPEVPPTAPTGAPEGQLTVSQTPRLPAPEVEAAQAVTEPPQVTPAAESTFPAMEEGVAEPTLRPKNAPRTEAEPVHPAIVPEMGKATYNWANKAGRKWVEAVAAIPTEEAAAKRAALVGRNKQKADIFDAIHPETAVASSTFVEPTPVLKGPSLEQVSPEAPAVTGTEGGLPPARVAAEPVEAAGVEPVKQGRRKLSTIEEPLTLPAPEPTEVVAEQPTEAMPFTDEARASLEEEIARQQEAAQVEQALAQQREEAGAYVNPEAVAEPVAVSPEPTVPKPVLDKDALLERRLNRLEEHLTNDDFLTIRNLLDTGNKTMAANRMADIEAARRENRYRTTEQTAPVQAMDHNELQAIADQVGKALGGDADVTILDSVSQLDPKAAPGSRAGMLHNGKVYLFRDGISSGIEGQKTVFHELLHKGLRALFGEQGYHEALNKLYSQSAPVREMADAWLADSYNQGDIEAYLKHFEPAQHETARRSLAVDEVLAVLAEDTKLSPSLLRQLGNWLASVADKLGMHALARNIRTMGIGPLQQFVNEALQAATTEAREINQGVATERGRRNPFAAAPGSFEALAASSGLAQDKPGYVQSALNTLGEAFSKSEGVDFMTKFRVMVTDVAASVENRLAAKFDSAVGTYRGMRNPMGLYRQAMDSGKLLLAWVEDGTLRKDASTLTWATAEVQGKPSVKEVLNDIAAYAKTNNMSFDMAYLSFSKMFEAKRLDELRTANAALRAAGEPEIPLHKLAKADPRTVDEQIDFGLAKFNATPEAAAILAKLDAMRFDLIDNMQAVGRLTPEEAQLWKDNSGYIPFDRIHDFDTGFKPSRRVGKGVSQLGNLPELIGSRSIEVGNTLDNFIRLSGWMIQQTLRQDANLTTLRTLEALGSAKFIGTAAAYANQKGRYDANRVVDAYINGEPVKFEVQSKWDTVAFKEMAEPKGFFVKAFEGFANVLRKTITAMPPFAMKQVAEDIQRAYITSGVENPSRLIYPAIRNFISIAGYELLGKEHKLVREFGRKGLTGEYDFNNRNPAESVLVDLGHRARGPVKTLLHRLEGITRASDLAVRAAIHQQTLAETRNVALADYRAREFINFRRRGAGRALPALTATIPFFNAYLQGMDVLYRAATGTNAAAGTSKAQAKRLFMSKALTMAGMASIYAFMMSGDDDYENASLQVRNSNWLLPGGLKIPVPAELAALFKVPVEMSLEYLRRSGTAEDMAASEAAITALRYAFEQYVGRVTPIPAAIKPVVEAITNHSFFTGRALEGNFQQTQDPSQRVTGSTSELAKAIAKFTSETFGEEATISPIKIDNFLRGYFGSVAGLVTMTTDQALNPDRIDRPLSKYWVLSTFMYDTDADGRRIDEFYDTREKVSTKLATLNRLKETDPDRAIQYIQEHEQELIMAQGVGQTLQQLAEVRKYKTFLNSPAGAQAMTQEERQAQLKELRQYELGMVEWLREVKSQMRGQ